MKPHVLMSIALAVSVLTGCDQEISADARMSENEEKTAAIGTYLVLENQIAPPDWILGTWMNETYATDGTPYSMTFSKDDIVFNYNRSSFLLSLKTMLLVVSSGLSIVEKQKDVDVYEFVVAMITTGILDEVSYQFVRTSDSELIGLISLKGISSNPIVFKKNV